MSETGRCWWCGKTRSEDVLLHLEGARLNGSPPLALPTRLSERQRIELVVDPECATALAEARVRHDAELFEAAIRPGGTAGPSPTVEDRLRRAARNEGGDSWTS